jgi:hypothetical protein
VWAAPISLEPPDGGGEGYGQSLALSGNTLVAGRALAAFVGEPEEDTGAAYVFYRGCADWAFTQKLTPPTPLTGSTFGDAVAVDGDLILVGDPGANNGAGAAYAFRKVGETWNFEHVFLPDALTNGKMGRSVAVSGGTVAIGAPEDDDQDTDAGAVYLFADGGKGWIALDKFVATDAEAFDLFGSSVSMHGNWLAIGSPFARAGIVIPGAAYVYEFVGEGWFFRQKLSASDAGTGDGFGSSLATLADTLFVGAPLDDLAGPINDAGSVYVFALSAGVWGEDDKLLAPVASSFERFGRSVAAGGDVLAIGAPRDKAGLLAPGTGYVFRENTGTWTFDHAVDSGGLLGDQFGASAAAGGNFAAFGAPLDATQGDAVGSVSVEYVGPVAATDYDADGDADVVDFASVQACLDGPAVDVPAECTLADLDEDGDADLADLADFLTAAACAP